MPDHQRDGAGVETAMDEKPDTKTPKTKTSKTKQRTAPDPRAFHVVWSPEGGDPVVRFPTFEAAKHSAWRLSEKYPGQSFFVLRSCWGRPARPQDVPATPGVAAAEQTHPGEADPSGALD